MKTLIAASSLALLAAAPAAAIAQEAGTTSMYGTLGYAGSSTEGVDLGDLQARIGARFGKYVGIEGELGAGVKNDKTTVSGTDVKIEPQHQAAVYGVGYLPVAPNIDLFARVGYGTSKIKVSGAGTSVADDSDSWNYGVGGQYMVNDKNGVRADYTRYDYRDSSANADVWALSYLRKF
jgi:outer membrane immunogenic protein